MKTSYKVISQNWQVVQSHYSGVSGPPSYGSSILWSSQLFARVMRKMPCLQEHLTNTATAERH